MMAHSSDSEQQLIALLLRNDPHKVLLKSIGIQMDKCEAKMWESCVMSVVFGGIVIAIFSCLCWFMLDHSFIYSHSQVPKLSFSAHILPVY